MGMWRYYYPDMDESLEDARPIGRDDVTDSVRAAEIACELDFCRHDGWERGETPFTLAVVSPDGSVTEYTAHHERSVYHRISAVN